MPEPTTTTAIGATTLIGTAAAVPILTLFGVSTGLRPDMLMAALAGSIAAMVFLNTVPSTGDTLLELFRTSIKRVFVSIASSVVGGYATPLFMLALTSPPDPVVLGTAFVVGAGAQTLLPKLIETLGNLLPKPRAGL